MSNFAAIDLGSNAARMKVVEARYRNYNRVLGQFRFPLRLGHDVFRTGIISEGSIEHAIEAFSLFSEQLQKYRVQDYRAIATSAVRESENRDQFLAEIAHATGIHLEIVSSTEEARLLMMSIRERETLGNDRILHLEIGGGSIELGVFDSRSCDLSTSMKLGAVRLHEMFLADSSGPANIRTEKAFIERMLADTVAEIRTLGPVRLVATGGNPKSLAKLSGVKQAYKRGSDLNFIPKAQLNGMISRLTRMSFKERIRLGLESDRADVIIPAGHLLSYLVDSLGFNGFYHMDIDLRDGLIRELVVDHFTKGQREAEETDIALGAALRLGRRFLFDEAHAVQVMNFAWKLFGALRPVHKLGTNELRLLWVAAILHDIGHAVGPSRHHKHSHYLIRNSELMGLTDRELEMTASIARFHRKSSPGRGHVEFNVLERKDQEKVRKLTAILRIADSLDREHKQRVIELGVVVTPKVLLLKIMTGSDCLLERWALEGHAAMFREVFELDIELQMEPVSGLLTKGGHRKAASARKVANRK